MKKISKKQRLLESKKNPLLNEAVRQKSFQNIAKIQQVGVFLADRLSIQDKYDLMMTILDKDCEERSNLEVNILTQIVSDIRFFRDMKSSTTDADETCFKLCKYMQGYFLPKNQVLFKQGDKGDTFWIIIKGEVRIYKTVQVKASKDSEQTELCDIVKQQQEDGVGGDNQNAGNGEEIQNIDQELVRLSSGNCFGEFALDPNKKSRRQACVSTTVDTFFGYIKADKIADIIQKINNSASFIEAYSRINLLKGYPYEVIKQFYDISDEMQVYKNQMIYDIQDTPECVYFVKEGEFSIYADKDFKNEFKQINEDQSDTQLVKNPNDEQVNKVQKKRVLAQNDRGRFVQLKILGQGECFGEEEILKKKNTQYYRINRVVCNSETGILYSVPKKSLLRLLPQQPNIYKAIITQIKNKEQARQLRLTQLEKTRFVNEEIGIDGQIRIKNEIPIQDTFKQDIQLFVPSHKKKIPENSLQKTVKMAKNCDLAENIFKEDDHNYLIFHSQIASNQYLSKNPKLRKEDANDEYEGVGDQKKLKIEEIDKIRLLKILELQNSEISEHETRSTLLYDEGLKKKKPVFQYKTGNLSEIEYLKDFSQKHNMPYEASPSSHSTKRQESLNSQQTTESMLQRRNTADFLGKANQQKNLLQENNKSIFYNNINASQSNLIFRSPQLGVQSSYMKDDLTESSLYPKEQRAASSSMHVRSKPMTPLSSFLNQDANILNKIPILQLDDTIGINRSNVKTANEHIRNNYSSYQNGSILQYSHVFNPISKSFMNNTPKTQKSPNELFKFLKPEFYNSPVKRTKPQTAEDNQFSPAVSQKALQQPFQSQGQDLTQKSINYQKHNRFQSIQIGDFSSAFAFSEEPSLFNCLSERNNSMQHRKVGSERTTKQVSPSVSITKIMTPTVKTIQQPGISNRSLSSKSLSQHLFQVTNSKAIINHKSTNHSNSIQSINKSNSQIINKPTTILKTVADELFKSKLPSNIRIKKFQLSSTFKNKDQSPQIGEGLENLQPLSLLNSTKFALQSRVKTPQI